MARIIDRPAEVTTGPGGTPLFFRFSGGRERVSEVLDCWVETGRWWEQEAEQITYRVGTANGGLFELTFCPQNRRWRLYKAYD